MSISLINQVRSVTLIANKIEDILGSSSDDLENISLDNFKNNIIINNLDFSYNKEKKALNNINLTLEKSKKYAIVGESGSGKIH